MNELGCNSSSSDFHFSHFKLFKTMQAGDDIDFLFNEAQMRWLKPAEVLLILQNHEKYELTQKPPQKPTSGSLFLFNKREVKNFRLDDHNWRKKKNGRGVGEGHERLKVGNAEALNCYYAHGEQNPSFQRRVYWMLDPAYCHIVLVHYRDITEGRRSRGSGAVSPASSTFIMSPKSYTAQNPGSSSVKSDLHEPYLRLSSPSSVEITSKTASKDNGVDSKGGLTKSDAEVNQALWKLKEQLSLNDDMFEEFDSLFRLDSECKSKISQQNQFEAFLQSSEYAVEEYEAEHAGFQDHSNNLLLPLDAGNDGKHLQQFYGHGYADGSHGHLSSKDMLESCENPLGVESQEKPLSSSWRGPVEEQEPSCWSNFNGSIVEHSSLLLPQEVKNFEIPEYSSIIGTQQTSSNYTTFFYHDHIGVPLEEELRSTVAQMQKFSIREISPDWGYANEATKVIIVGSFLCDPSESAWSCMFGDTEVPLQIIQDGVIRCEAPPRIPGKVTLCITSGNQQSCSEVKEFDYRVKTSSNTHDNWSQKEATKSRDELLLLVRFVQMLLSYSSVPKEDRAESGYQLLQRMKSDDDDLWGQVIESLLVGSGTYPDTIDWLLQELLKDKLQQWLSTKSLGEPDQSGCSLSKKEQGIIHMVGGLGFEWALNPILSHGVSINFRDINGWTALHWASRFGREKMVAALLAFGASAGAVTDPNAQDPTGRTPASIAASNGHKGLAGYLSEAALTSHLSSLTLEESELSKNSAAVQAEITVSSVSNGNLSTIEDQLSLKDTLAAVRNAAQAAARIQAAFRAHSFRKRQQREAAASGANIDEYGINSDDIPGLSAISKLAFLNRRDYNSAALSIQKKYRGWKGRKNYLAIHQKVVKIQAHVRGYQARKHYKVICWAVGILDKVILRWRRKGVGLRGFRPETESTDENEDEDILKVFRSLKVDAAIDEAISRVLSMVDCPSARHQYSRMLERYRQAKAELGETSEAAAAALSASETVDMDDDHDSYRFL